MTNLKRDFELEVFFSKWEFNACYNIGCSDLQTMKLSELLEFGDDKDLQKWDDCSLGYTETPGLPELREVISDTYDTITSDDILCFSGAEEGIFCAMHALLGPDDHALVCYPNYQSAETVPLSICEVTGISLNPDQNWTIDIDHLRSEIRPNTKLISINFPNNPTGKILEKDKYEAIIELCRKRRIFLFSDEVYRLIERVICSPELDSDRMLVFNVRIGIRKGAKHEEKTVHGVTDCLCSPPSGERHFSG